MANDAHDEDVVLLGPPLPDGGGAAVLRKRGEDLEVGAIRPVEEGKPLHGEVVRLRPRAGQPHVCDVEVLYDGRPASSATAAAARAASAAMPGVSPGPRERPSPPVPARRALAAGEGPPQVASEAYRAGWDAVFGRGAAARKARGTLN
jgi:hypothetical protein